MFLPWAGDVVGIEVGFFYLGCDARAPTGPLIGVGGRGELDDICFYAEGGCAYFEYVGPRRRRTHEPPDRNLPVDERVPGVARGSTASSFASAEAPEGVYDS
eukprot:3891264-Pyramimonas_sp.AAC.1